MNLGKIHTLRILRMRSVGAYLEGDILLPQKEVPGEAKVGDSLKVFVWYDSEARPIATMQYPKVQVGEFAFLEVKDTSKIGAFLDWGMPKDLLLPFREQLHKVKKYERVFIYCYLDKSNRFCATMRVKDRFSTPKSFKENDYAEGLVYSVNPAMGAFVLVDSQYNGMIPSSEMMGALKIGQKIHVRITGIKPDGKIDLSMQSRSYERIHQDAHKIETMLRQNDGFLRVNDHSDPESIDILFGMSKAQFKRSLGHLLKAGKICFEGDGIRRIDDKNSRTIKPSDRCKEKK